MDVADQGSSFGVDVQAARRCAVSQRVAEGFDDRLRDLSDQPAAWRLRLGDRPHTAERQPRARTVVIAAEPQSALPA